MKKFLAMLVLFVLTAVCAVSAEEAELTIIYNGEQLTFGEKPIIMNDKTLVQIRPIAEAMGLEIAFENGQVCLSDEVTSVVFTLDSDVVKVNGEETVMTVPMVLKNDYTFVPVRDLAEPFGCLLEYDGTTKTVTISKETCADEVDAEEKIEDEFEEEIKEEISRPAKNETDENAVEEKEIGTGSGEYEFTYFYQSQPDIGFENNGRGYCWVCAYAMLFSNATKSVITPLDIAQYNINAGYNGSFMSGHETLASSFGLKLVTAISENSPYYADFNTKNKGETTFNITSDEDASAVIREALDRFPYGVIVRYEGYPHSMMAVSYDDENIYFNDPGLASGEHVTFENTSLKNFKLSDISYIQAVEVK